MNFLSWRLFPMFYAYIKGFYVEFALTMRLLSFPRLHLSLVCLTAVLSLSPLVASESDGPTIYLALDEVNCPIKIVGWHYNESYSEGLAGQVAVKNYGESIYFVPNAMSPDKIEFASKREGEDDGLISKRVALLSHVSSNGFIWNDASVRGTSYNLLAPNGVINIAIYIPDQAVASLRRGNERLWSLTISPLVFKAHLVNGAGHDFND